MKIMHSALKESRILTARLGLSTLLVFSASASVPPSAAACGTTSIALDYLQPLNRMAPIQEPPPSGKLPFAPRGLRLDAPQRPLVVGDGSVGFHLRDEAVQQLRHLDWIVETRLSKVNSRGEVVANLGIKRRKVGSVVGSDIGEFVHRLSGHPAFYRMDISFIERSTHRLLGEYGTYARLVSPRVDVRVAIEGRMALPGEYARARLINFGTVPLVTRAYDFGFGVQAFTGTRWVHVPENPPRGPVPLRAKWSLGAGVETRGCLRYLVPTDQPPGLYRFVSFGLLEADALLAAQFEVMPQPSMEPK